MVKLSARNLVFLLLGLGLLYVAALFFQCSAGQHCLVPDRIAQAAIEVTGGEWSSDFVGPTTVRMTSEGETYEVPIPPPWVGH
jgi:hypothetical protein